ncbi:MAG: hypothetical protein Q4B28_08675 [bacterium]|nr:hypothetical protein [bacterium]
MVQALRFKLLFFLHKLMTYKRQGLHTIPDQGNEGSCTAFALCNLINGYKDPKRKAAGGEWEYLD